MEQDFSSIKVLEKIVQLALPITFISNEISGVLETLESWKRQYNPQLEGILVKYSNVSLMSRSNKVIISRNSIIIDVKAKFHLFCPKVGDVVKGKVNRVTRELVGCIMHDTINATIYLSNYYPGELKKFIRIDHEILFEIIHFSCFRNEVRVQGKFTPDCLTLMTERFPAVEEEMLTNFSFQNENTITHYSDIEECEVFKSEIATVDIDESCAELKKELKSESMPKKPNKKRKLEGEPSDEPRKKKRKKNTSSEADMVNGASSVHEQEPVLKNESESCDESTLRDFLQNHLEPESLTRPMDGNLTKKKKQKKLKKSKKGKVVATGTVVKSDKKKKHAKKDKLKKISEKSKTKKDRKSKDKKADKKSKSKKGHKKEKLSDCLLNNDFEIKSEF